MKFSTLPRALTGALMLVSAASHALPIQYAGNRAGFEATLVSAITDDYSNAAYTVGDYLDVPGVDLFTDAGMSGVLGETEYRSTAGSHINYVYSQFLNAAYCAGCNGSFELSFTSTSVGDATGVFGVGFDIVDIVVPSSFFAFVTLGDNTTLNVDFSSFQPGFWGITAPERIRSIHFGLADGGAEQDTFFGIDNLTIGRESEGSDPTPVPEPTGLGLLGLGLVAAGLQRRRHIA